MCWRSTLCCRVWLWAANQHASADLWVRAVAHQLCPVQLAGRSHGEKLAVWVSVGCRNGREPEVLVRRWPKNLRIGTGRAGLLTRREGKDQREKSVEEMRGLAICVKNVILWVVALMNCKCEDPANSDFEVSFVSYIWLKNFQWFLNVELWGHG